MMNGRIPVELQRSDVVPLSPSSNKMLR
jgi:hypothetical protein